MPEPGDDRAFSRFAASIIGLYPEPLLTHSNCRLGKAPAIVGKLQVL
jgi:hypothetical protein